MTNFLIQLGNSLSLNYSKDYMTLYGEYRNYKLYISEDSNNNSFLIRFPFSLDSSAYDSLSQNLINQLKANNPKLYNCQFKSTTLYINLKGVTDVEKNIENINDTTNITNIINEVISFAEANNIKSCCEICKCNLPTALHHIDNNLFLMCDTCYMKSQNIMKEHKEYEKNIKSPNIVTGIVGALLGSLIGVVLWVIVFQLGYIASICGMILAICAMKGFELFGGRLTKSGIIITLLITIVMVYVSNYLSFGIDIYNVFKDTENITIFEGIKNVSYFLTEYPDFKTEFIKSLLMGYGFTVLGTFSTFKRALQSR